MADLQLRIMGEDNASSAFNSASASIRSAMQVAIDFTRQSVRAYAESERVQRQLELVAKGLTSAFQAQAQALAQANAVSDEMVQQVQTMLLRYGAAPAAVEATTQAILDYAAATGTDARAATEALTRGVEAGTGNLKGLGVQFQATGERAEDLRRAVAALGEKFGGAAGADAASVAGQVRGVEEAFGDLQEAFGGFVLEVASKTGVLGFLTQELRNIAKGAEIARDFLSGGGAEALLDTGKAFLFGGDGDVGKAKLRLQSVVGTTLARQAQDAAVGPQLRAAAMARGGGGRRGAVGRGGAGGAGRAELEGEMLGPQTYEAFLNDPSRPMLGPEAPSGAEWASMRSVQEAGARRQAEAHAKALEDSLRATRETAKKLAEEQRTFAQAGAQLGGAFAQSLAGAIESLAGGGEQDIGKTILNVITGLLGTVGGFLGNLLLPGLGGALGAGLGGLAGAGVRALAGASGPQVNINTFDARSTREFFEADGGRGLHNAKRTGRGQGW